MARIIVEGMDHDRTCLNYIAGEEEIPPQTGSIKTWGNTLEYQGLMKGGKLENGTIHGGLEIKLPFFPLFESTCTVIVEDGRIYSCTWGGDNRLKETLRDIFEIAGSFESAYRQMEENPGKFLHNW